MARMRRDLDPEERQRVWAGIAKFLALLLLVALFFMLARSMVEHHFFTGGAQNYHNSPTGP